MGESAYEVLVLDFLVVRIEEPPKKGEYPTLRLTGLEPILFTEIVEDPFAYGEEDECGELFGTSLMLILLFAGTPAGVSGYTE